MSEEYLTGPSYLSVAFFITLLQLPWIALLQQSTITLGHIVATMSLDIIVAPMTSDKTLATLVFSNVFVTIALDHTVARMTSDKVVTTITFDTIVALVISFVALLMAFPVSWRKEHL
jgi:hypothetical protein